MTAEVRLTIVRGLSEGKVFTFRERAIGAVGRADDCLLRMPTNVGHLDVSRRHCLLDIEPPAIRVRDLGSRNGTFVNEEKIGQREPGRPPEAASAAGLPERLLEDGDELRVGGTVFRVSISGERGAAQTSSQTTASGGVLTG